MLIAPSTASGILAPAGLHLGVLYQIVDLGSHFNESFNNTQHKVRLTWELSEERMDDGRPLSVSLQATLSGNEKSILHKLVKGWTGEDISGGFDLSTLLGRAGNVNVTHEVGQTGKTYAKVNGVTPLMKSQQVPPCVNPPVLFDMTGGAVDTAVFNKLPEFLKEKIMASPEYQHAVARANGLGPAVKRERALSEDEVPFGHDLPPADAYGELKY